MRSGDTWLLCRKWIKETKMEGPSWNVTSRYLSWVIAGSHFQPAHFPSFKDCPFGAGYPVRPKAGPGLGSEIREHGDSGAFVALENGQEMGGGGWAGSPRLGNCWAMPVISGRGSPIVPRQQVRSSVLGSRACQLHSRHLLVIVLSIPICGRAPSTQGTHGAIRAVVVHEQELYTVWLPLSPLHCCL